MRSNEDEPDPEGGDPASRSADPAAGGVAAGGGSRCRPAGGDPNAVAGAGDVTQLVAEMRAADRHIAAAVMLAGRLAAAGVAEAQVGMPVEQVLVTACRATGSDRHTLVTAGRVLADMPGLRGLFEAGEVSWGQVRGIVARAKRLSRDRLAWLDARLAATIDQRGSLSGFDPDELVDAAGDAVDELSELDRLERGEREAIADSFLAIQPDFLGGVRAYGELDPQTAAPILDALQAASPAPHARHRDHADDDSQDGHGDGHGDGDGQEAGAASSGWSAPSRSRQHADGLWRLASEWLAGHRGEVTDGDGAEHAGGDRGGDPGDGGRCTPATARAARPQVTVQVRLDQATAAVAGHVDLAASGPLPRLTAAAVDALACCGDVQAVVFDGARPLATTQKVSAATIPTATRRAIELRDGGCRWPGCQAPLAHCDLHHLVPRARSGEHDPENLVAVCRRHHTQLHARGWELAVDGDTGAVTGWRHGRWRWTSHPPATRLAHPHTASPDQAGHDHGSHGQPHHGQPHHGDGHPGDPPARHDPPTRDSASGDGRDPPGGGDGRDPPDDDRPYTDHLGNSLPF